MSSMLYSLGRWAFRTRKTVLVAWVLLLALLGGGAAMFSAGTENSFSIPGTDSQEALDTLSTTFPEVAGSSAQIVVVAAEGSRIDDPAYTGPISDALAEIRTIKHVSGAPGFDDTDAPPAISDDGRAAQLTIRVDGSSDDIGPETKDALTAAADELGSTLPEGTESALGGELFSIAIPGLTVTEAVGLLIALVVLFLTFGSFAAAGMPLLTAIIGVGVSMTLIMLATLIAPVTSTTPLLAVMLGLAVGIDYALFIIARHQEQLKNGLDPEESAARATATAGSAVIFAGITVIIALLGLGVAGIPFLTTMGVAAAVSVALAVLVSLTLVPALLGFAGDRVAGRAHRRAVAAHEKATARARAEATTAAEREKAEAAAPLGAPRPNRFFAGWVRAVTRFPLVTILAVVGVLGLAIIPASQLRLALPDASNLPTSNSARQSYDLAAEHFGAGVNGPLIVTGSIVTSEDPVGLVGDIADELEKLPGVESIGAATPNRSADTAFIVVIPTEGPNAQSTQDLVHDIRAQKAAIEDRFDFSLSVTGFTALGIDVSEKLGGALLPFGILVVGLSLILLAMVFRSIAVPLKATLGYLLSVVASFGAVAMVFEWGIFADALNVGQTGPIISFLPIILMGVLFGLAMDYEVFLVAKIREDYVHGKNARGAIVSGFTSSAKVVTAAALIMIGVFAAFVPHGDTSIKPIALGLAVGVFVDAFLVRMTLVPAVLQLLGDKAWYLPRWLDRLLPSFDVEGENLHRELEMAAWPEPGATDAIAAEHLAVRDEKRGDTLFAGVTLRLAPGGTLRVTSGEAHRRTALLLTLTGRLAPSAGQLKVAGLVAPIRGAGIRARAGYVHLAGPEDPVLLLRRALDERPQILAVDGLDHIDDAAVRLRIHAELDAAQARAARSDHPLTLLLAGLDAPALPGSTDTTVIDLDTATDRPEVFA